MLIKEKTPQPHTDCAILVEPHRIVGRTTTSGEVDIEPHRPVERILGGYAVYCSTGLPFALDTGQGWQFHDRLVVVSPYQRHRLRRCEGLRTILIEPESVSVATMADERWVPGSPSYPGWVARIDRGFANWLRSGTLPGFTADEMIFGENLPARELDPRVAKVIGHITNGPHHTEPGIEALAQSVSISPSRLSHLFREQVGTSIRSFRAWKRVRHAIRLTVNEPALVRAAVSAGYADEAHFSRSMRKYFGQQANLMRRHWRATMVFQEDQPSHGSILARREAPSTAARFKATNP